MLNPDKVLVTSKGNITYTAKDLAHHLWKFGLVSSIPFKEFSVQENGEPLWISVKDGEVKEELYKFKTSYAVVDVSQSYNFDVIKAIFKKFGYSDELKNLHHVAYGLVALSKETVKELGFDVKDDKEAYQMSGRKGIGVKVDDLLSLMVKKVEAKQQETASQDDGVELIPAKKIAAGAVKAYMFKHNINNTIVFDINEALKITGDSGPYLQYTHARIKGIIRKAAQPDIKEFNVSHLQTEEAQVLLKKIYRFSEAVALAARQVNPGVIYNYLIDLCQDFNSFYNKCPILKAEEDVKAARLVLIEATAQVIKNGLNLLGMEAPEKM